MNTFGNIFRLTSFGESHGPAIGGVIDGCPAGIELDFERIQQELNRRRPGQSRLTTARKESDEVQFLSGIYEGKTTGTPEIRHTRPARRGALLGPRDDFALRSRGDCPPDSAATRHLALGLYFASR